MNNLNKMVDFTVSTNAQAVSLILTNRPMVLAKNHQRVVLVEGCFPSWIFGVCVLY